jgi:hypothetical protein
LGQPGRERVKQMGEYTNVVTLFKNPRVLRVDNIKKQAKKKTRRYAKFLLFLAD